MSMTEQGSSGFTLLETMMAIGILAIVLTAVLRMHSQTLFVNRQAKFHAVAAMLAQEKLSQIDNGVPEDDSGVFDREFSGYSWRVSVEDWVSNLSIRSRWRLKKIEIFIQNPDKEQFVLRTYRYVLL